LRKLLNDFLIFYNILILDIFISTLNMLFTFNGANFYNLNQRKHLYILIIGLLLYVIEIVTAKNCDPSEIIYEYTPCDQNGERWRIALPKSHLIQCENLPPPKSGVNCSFSCTSGHFLNFETQECQECPQGTYSLGSGQRYEDLKKWPNGFTVENYEDASEHFFQTQSQLTKEECSSA
jgi:hypothetical protein